MTITNIVVDDTTVLGDKDGETYELTAAEIIALPQDEQAKVPMPLILQAYRDANAQLVAEKAAALAKAGSKAGRVRTANGLTLQVSDKGAVSVYGMARFPTTLYAEQWHKLAAAMPEIVDFIRENDSKLTHKA